MRPEIRATIEHILAHYSNELLCYTVKGVKDTPHVPPGSQEKADNWTVSLSEYLDESDSPALVSLRASLKGSGKKLIELERTFSAIHCFRMCQQENYAGFVESQMDLSDKFTRESFDLLVKFIRGRIPDLESQTVLESLIFFSDLGKSPETKERASKAGVNPALDSDDLMLAILRLPDEKIEVIVPHYKSLGALAKQLLKDASPMMTACFGHLFFLEGNSKILHTIADSLERLPKDLAQRTKILDLVFAAQFFDGAGAQGQTFMYGSRTCTNDFYRGYMLMHETMQTLNRSLCQRSPASEVSTLISEAFQVYLRERAAWMELGASKFKSQDDFEVVLRLACTLRLMDKATDKKVARELTMAFYALKPEHQLLLSTQLNLDGTKGLNRVAHAPNYVATGAQNICRNISGVPLSPEDIQSVWNYTIVLARLIEKLWLEHSLVLEDAMLPLNFGGLACLTRDPQNFANPDDFDLKTLLSKEPILPESTTKRLAARAPDAFFQKGDAVQHGAGAGAAVPSSFSPKPF